MTEPIKSQYDDDPIDPDAPAGEEEKVDLGNTQSPDLEVAWDERPSFNTEPKDIDHGDAGEPSKQEAVAGDFSVNLESVGTQVDNMLATSRVLVRKYEDLRNKVLTTKDTVFGQQTTQEENGTFDFSTGQYWAPDESDPPTPTVWAEPGMEFAAQMNPAQEKALQHIGGVLELIGEYIAMVNHSGQAYAEADRNSRFPAPPPGSVVD